MGCGRKREHMRRGGAKRDRGSAHSGPRPRVTFRGFGRNVLLIHLTRREQGATVGLDQWAHDGTGATVPKHRHANQYRRNVLPVVLVTCAVLADAECRSASQIRVSVDGLVFPIDDEI